MAFGHKQPTPWWTCFDLAMHIRKALLESPIQWKYYHVKGHQDTYSNFSHLPYNAKGNIFTDHFATKVYSDVSPDSQPDSVPP